jgi:hypothetical protein
MLRTTPPGFVIVSTSVDALPVTGGLDDELDVELLREALLCR